MISIRNALVLRRDLNAPMCRHIEDNQTEMHAVLGKTLGDRLASDRLGC